MSRTSVDQCVEALCLKGCKEVWGDIEALEQGIPLPETRSLSASERGMVLQELKSIMSVYAGSCEPGQD